MATKLIAALAISLTLLGGCVDSQMGVSQAARNVAGVRNGMSENQVVAMLGDPSRRSTVQGEADVPIVQLRWVSNNSLITVHLMDGRVIGVDSY